MPADQLVSLASLCVKTGRIARGEALLPSITSRKAQMVLLSDGCGANRKKKIQDKCRFYQVVLVQIPASRFERISGKVNGAAAVLDPGFAKKLTELAKAQSLLPDSQVHLWNMAPDVNPGSHE